MEPEPAEATPDLVALLTAAIHDDSDTCIDILDDLDRAQLYRLVGALVGSYFAATSTLADMLDADRDELVLTVLRGTALNALNDSEDDR